MQNSMNDLAQKAITDFDHYIHLLTLNAKKVLHISLDEPNLYHSKEHEQATRFYNAFKTCLEQNKNERNELLDFTNSATKTKTTSHSAARNKNSLSRCALNTMGLSVPGAIAVTYGVNNLVNKADTLSGFEGVGDALLSVSGGVMFGIAAIKVNECISTHFKKRETEHISQYLKDDQEPMIDLISALFTLHGVGPLNSDKKLCEAQIKRRAQKEAEHLIKELIQLKKLEKKKNKELPHLLADTLLCKNSSRDEYLLEKRKSSLKHWLAALEKIIKKDNELNVFLNKLEALRLTTEYDIGIPNSKQATENPPHFSPQNRTSTA